MTRVRSFLHISAVVQPMLDAGNTICVDGMQKEIVILIVDRHLCDTLAAGSAMRKFVIRRCRAKQFRSSAGRCHGTQPK